MTGSPKFSARPIGERGEVPLESQDYLYNIGLHGAAVGILPYLWCKLRDAPDFLSGRLGNYPPDILPSGSPRVWFHASSVGEVTGAVPTVQALLERLPSAVAVLTVGTPQGLRHARGRLPESVPVIPFPLDFPTVLRKAFRRLKPDLYVGFESEFWPNLFRFLRMNEVRSVLLNGRVADRSARRYARLRSVFQPIFRQFEWLAMHSEEDLQNVLSLGASPERALVLGSSKYEGLLSKADPEVPVRWRRQLDIPRQAPVVIGGSLRGAECRQVPEAFGKLRELCPEAIGIFVPRHLERIPEMVQWMESRGIAFHRLSDIEGTGRRRVFPVVLVDRIGILFELYSIGDLIFCGGTLEPVGGHNILEPAAWGKAVFYGPHLKKVRYEHRILLESKCSFPVSDSDELASRWRFWVRRLPELKEYGERARNALEKMGGVVSRQVELILAAFPERFFGVR